MTEAGERDDDDLIRAVARGDAAAFEALYRRHKDGLLSVTASLCGDRAAAEDILHDVFVAIAERPPNLREAGSVRAYLYRACVHRTRDRHRRRRREEDGRAWLARAAPDGATTGDLAGGAREAEDRETRRRLVAALERLAPAQREVVGLRLLAGLRFREIAAVQGATLRTVQSRFRYGVAALRDRLAVREAPGSIAREAVNTPAGRRRMR